MIILICLKLFNYIYIIINVIADFAFADFKWLYLYIYKNNLKNLTIYRFNELLGAILLVKEEKPKITKITLLRKIIQI